MKNFTEYYEKLKSDNKVKVHNAYYQILTSVSKADSRSAHSSCLSAELIVKELLEYFGSDNVTFPQNLSEIDEYLDYLAVNLNIFKRSVFLRGDWRLETTAPLLASLNGNYIMLIPLAGGGYSYIDPVSLKQMVLSDNVSKEISPKAYCFYRGLPGRPLSFTDICSFIIKCISKKEYINLIFVSVFVLLINLFVPVLNKLMFDIIIPSGTTDDIWPVAGLLLGISLASISFGVLKEFSFLRSSNKVTVYLEGAIWARVFNLPASFFKQHSSSNIYQQAVSVIKIGEILSGTAISTALTCMLSFIYVFQIANFTPILVLPTIIISLLLVLFSILMSILSVKYQKSQITLRAKLDSFVFEIFSGISKIKIAGAQIRVFYKWAEKYSSLTKITYSPNIFIIASNALYRAVTLCSTIFIYFMAAKNNISPANFIGFSVAFAAFTVMLLQFQDIVIQIANLTSALDIAKPLLQETSENSEDRSKVKKLSGNIEISNVSFKYSDNGPMVLDELSISIKAGEYVAIVGSSGCGKSTLLRILLGFEKPVSGSVYYDNQDISGLSLAGIRRQISVVMQNDTLFADSIYSNIAICNPSLSLDEAFEIAAKAGLEDDINNMPMGMFTMISENAGGISGGQKQRLMIARAFASNPSIIMFDEATSALDNISQQKIISSLEKFNATKIVIAHRLSTVIKCDKIFVLDKGKIAEMGTYDELIDKGGLFYEMAKRQLV